MLTYDPTKIKWATEVDPDSLTEQEHTSSCDINKMILDMQRGLMVRGGGSITYGEDDTTMDAVQFRNEKARLEHELSEAAKAQEYLEEELASIPETIRKKFGFKTKKVSTTKPAQNDDDQTTTKNAVKETKKTKTEDEKS